MRKKVLFLVLLALLMAPSGFGQEIMQTARGPARVSFLPQFLAGGGYQTILTIRNLSAERQQVGVDWFAPDGQTTKLVGNGVLQNFFVVNLATETEIAGGFRKILISPDNGLRTGSIRFFQPFDPVTGQLLTSVSITYQKVNDDGSVGDISNLSPVETTNRVAFYWGNNLGLAIANSSEKNSITISLTRKGSGETVTMALPPQGQVARVVRELFPGLRSQDLLELVSSAPVAVLLLASEDGKFQAVAVATAKQ